jgi:uncharacterized membrane protein YphA (DoxX/SURF4 family)
MRVAISEHEYSLRGRNSIGFFMNWAGNQAGEGFEYHLVAIAALLPIVIAGPGRFGVGRLFAKVAGKETLAAVLE